MTSDVQLLLASRRGDQNAASTLWERHAARLAAYLAAILGSRHDADDVLQGVFCSLLTIPDSRIRAVREFAPFLTRIARNAAINHVRTTHRSRTRDTTAVSRRESTAAATDESDDLRRAISRLPRRQREVLILRHVGGLTFDQIAEALDTSKSTIASRHEAATRALRQQLEETPRRGETPPPAALRNGEVLHAR
jgi:RNA polymerase sigma-70 factor, ECF subfamily